MDIRELNRNKLADGVMRIVYELPAAGFLYMGYILESLEGVCSYTTIDKRKNQLQVDVVADYLQEYNELIKSLQEMDI